MKKEFDDLGAVILGCSVDDQEANAAFAEKYGFDFPLLCDTDRTIGMSYGACDSSEAGFARRISYLIDGEGKVAAAYGKVDPAAHAAEALRDLKALVTGRNGRGGSGSA